MRSKVDEFQKFRAEESLQKIKAMTIGDDDNKACEDESEVARKRSEAVDFKNKGNTFVKNKEYESAIKMYSRAIELCNDDSVFYSNRSQCYLSLEKYQECVEDATKAIDLDPLSTKSLYRQMTAYEKLGDDFKALKSCRLWLDLAPEDQTCKNSYDRIHNRIVEAEKKKDKEKIRWSRFGSESKITNFVTKPPHMRSNRPLKKITVRLRKAASPIPEAVIDRIFGNNTGENVLEPETDSKLFKPNFLCSPQPPKIAKLSENDEVQVISEKQKLDKTNESLKAAEVKKDLKIEDLETLNSHLAVIPSSGPMFYGIWKELGEIQRFVYLKNIAANGVPIGKLLGAQLDSEMLSQIIEIVHKHFTTYNVPFLRLLSDLGKNSELEVLAMFLDNEEKSSELNRKILNCSKYLNTFFSLQDSTNSLCRHLRVEITKSAT